MPDGPAGMPCAVTRRALLLGLGAGALSASVAGCGIRFEGDAPHIPLVPLRHPVPGETALIALLHDTRELAALTSSAGGLRSGLPARLSKLHARQAQVLHDALRRDGVPQELLEAAASASTSAPSGTTSTRSASSPTSAAAPTVATLTAGEVAALEASWSEGLAEVGSDVFTPVNALLAQRRAAATLLGKPPPTPAVRWPSAALAVPFLAATRAAVYGFQVVGAQIDASGRALAGATLAELDAIEALQSALAGEAAPEPPLGYPLPFAVTTPRAARRLAGHLVTGLRASIADGLMTVEGQREAAPRVVAWLAAAEVLASRWGVPLAPFPGLA